MHCLEPALKKKKTLKSYGTRLRKQRATLHTHVPVGAIRLSKSYHTQTWEEISSKALKQHTKGPGFDP